MARDIAHVVLLLTGRAAQHVPQALGLDVVVVVDLLEDVVYRLAAPLLVCGGWVGGLVGQGPVTAGTERVLAGIGWLNGRK